MVSGHLQVPIICTYDTTHVRALVQMSGGDRGERRQKAEAERAAALAKIEADREAQHQRTAREQAARHALGVAAVKSPWSPSRRRRRRTGGGSAGGGSEDAGASDDEDGDGDAPSGEF